MARILEWFIIPSFSGLCIVRTLHYYPSILVGHEQHGSQLFKLDNPLHQDKAVIHERVYDHNFQELCFLRSETCKINTNFPEVIDILLRHIYLSFFFFKLQLLILSELYSQLEYTCSPEGSFSTWESVMSIRLLSVTNLTQVRYSGCTQLIFFLKVSQTKIFQVIIPSFSKDLLTILVRNLIVQKNMHFFPMLSPHECVYIYEFSTYPNFPIFVLSLMLGRILLLSPKTQRQSEVRLSFEQMQVN